MSESDDFPWCKSHVLGGKNGCLLMIYVQPGASKACVRGVFESDPPRLKISVAAAPTEGKANEAVILFLSKTLILAKAKIHIVSGETSRQKNIFIEDASAASVALMLLENSVN